MPCPGGPLPNRPLNCRTPRLPTRLPTALQGLANILWALGKLGVKVTHEIRQMVEALTEEMLEQLTRSRHKGGWDGWVGQQHRRHVEALTAEVWSS